MESIEVVYVALVYLSETDGIAKKVMSQAKGFSMAVGRCLLVCCEANNIVRLEINYGQIKSKTVLRTLSNVGNNSRQRIDTIKELVKTAKTELHSDNQLLYVRHMIPSVSLISFLKKAKSLGIKIGYEIPTYPYYYEQFTVANNKIKAIVKIINDTLYWPLIYRNISKLFIIVCNNKARRYKKMYSICNGIELISKFEYKDRPLKDKFNMVGVGTIWPYHGYDRIINAIAAIGGNLNNGKAVMFHIVGESDEIEHLKELAKIKNIASNIIFHGKKFGQELEDIYYECHIGVGTLALNKRKADIDTAIKNIEYFSQSLPVITGGKIFDINEETGLYYVSKWDAEIDLDDVFEFYQRFTSADFDSSLSSIIARYSWDSITHEITDELQK